MEGDGRSIFCHSLDDILVAWQQKFTPAKLTCKTISMKNQTAFPGSASDEDCGCHKASGKGRHHSGQHEDCRECGEYLVKQAEAWMQAGTAEDFMEGFFTGGTTLSEGFSHHKNGSSRAKQLFDSIVFGRSTPLCESWQQGVDVVASPKSRLTNSLLPGDLVLSRSFGDGKTWQSMAVSGELLSREQARARGLAPDSGKPGFYLEVAMVQPFVRHGGEGYVRRIGDEWGRLLPDQLVLRARPQKIRSGRTCWLTLTNSAPKTWWYSVPTRLTQPALPNRP